jgi:hypothetical protein
MSVKFICKSKFSCEVEKLFAFHESPQGFETLVGLEKGVKVLQKPNSLNIGERAILEVEILPFWKVTWIAEHTNYKKHELFQDTQIQGPFKKFVHSHVFQTLDKNSILSDEIELDFYFLPISKIFILQKLKSQFLNRHRITAKTLNVSYENLFCGFIN